MESVLDDIIDKSGILDNINGISNERSISAFVSWSQEFVEISYPRAGDAWVKRSDCGSHSQHRWGLYDNELYEVVQLVVKHSSCLKAMFMQPLCKNCEMRHVWRQPCRTPSNVFFILALTDVETCQSYLEPLIISRKALSPNNIDIYTRYTPKPVFHAKVVKSTPKKRKQLDRLEKDIESSIVASNRKLKTSSELEFKSMEPGQTLEQQQEAKTLEQQQEAHILEQQQEAKTLEQQQEAKTLEQQQEAKTLENQQEAQLLEFMADQ